VGGTRFGERTWEICVRSETNAIVRKDWNASLDKSINIIDVALCGTLPLLGGLLGGGSCKLRVDCDNLTPGYFICVGI